MAHHVRATTVKLLPRQFLRSGAERLLPVDLAAHSRESHFVFSDSAYVVDPFLEEMWFDPPVYNTPLSLLDAVIREGIVDHVDEVKDPAPNLAIFAPGSDFLPV